MWVTFWGWRLGTTYQEQDGGWCYFDVINNLIVDFFHSAKTHIK